MSVLTRATDALRELEAELSQYPYMASGEAGGDPSLYLSERIREVRRLLSRDDDRWISLTKARRLLGVDSEDTVRTWAKLGLLRSRTQPNGRIQVLLDDVLRDREAAEGLTAFGGRELTEEELEAEHQARPGPLPWEREQVAAPR